MQTVCLARADAVPVREATSRGTAYSAGRLWTNMVARDGIETSTRGFSDDTDPDPNAPEEP